MLVLVMIQVILSPDYSVLDAVWFFAHELVVGVVAGLLVGALAAVALRRLTDAPAGLTLVCSLASAAIAFGAGGSTGGSGFLAVYIAGLVIGSARQQPLRKAMLAFHEGLAGVAEIGMFFALGLLVFPSQLGGVLVRGTLLALAVAVLARPLAAFVATLLGDFNVRERLLLGWAGLRGGVPVVLATLPVIARVPNSSDFFNLVFFAVLVSTLVQGATVQWLAQRLGISAPPPAPHRTSPAAPSVPRR